MSGTDDLSGAVERLRKSLDESRKAHEAEGFEYGECWAKQAAGAEQLQSLDSVYQETPMHDFMDADSVMQAVGVDYDDATEADEFWQSAGVAGYDCVNSRPGFAKGFVRGALHIWRQVKDQVVSE